MVQMPAVNTPQFSWVLSRLPAPRSRCRRSTSPRSPRALWCTPPTTPADASTGSAPARRHAGRERGRARAARPLPGPDRLRRPSRPSQPRDPDQPATSGSRRTAPMDATSARTASSTSKSRAMSQLWASQPPRRRLRGGGRAHRPEPSRRRGTCSGDEGRVGRPRAWTRRRAGSGRYVTSTTEGAWRAPAAWQDSQTDLAAASTARSGSTPGRAAAYSTDALELPPGADRRRRAAQRRGRCGRGRRVCRDARRTDLSRAAAARAWPDSAPTPPSSSTSPSTATGWSSVDEDARTLRRRAGHRAGRAQPAARADRPALRAGAGDAHELHARRDDRQQLLRRDCAAHRQGRRQRRRPGGAALRRHPHQVRADDRRRRTRAIERRGDRRAEVYRALRRIRDEQARPIRDAVPRHPAPGVRLQPRLAAAGARLRRRRRPRRERVDPGHRAPRRARAGAGRRGADAGGARLPRHRRRRRRGARRSSSTTRSRWRASTTTCPRPAAEGASTRRRSTSCPRAPAT